MTAPTPEPRRADGVPTDEDQRNARALLGVFPDSKVGIGQANLIDRIALALATAYQRGHRNGALAVMAQRSQEDRP